MTNQSKSILKRHAIQRKNDLAPLEELSEKLEIYSESHYDSINDTDYTEYTLTTFQLEQLRQAIIRDFVSTLEPVAWTYTKRNGEPTVTLDFNFATIVIGDGFDVTRLFNLSEWSK